MKPGCATVSAHIGQTLRADIDRACPGVTIRALTIALFTLLLQSMSPKEGGSPTILHNVLAGTARIVPKE